MKIKMHEPLALTTEAVTALPRLDLRSGDTLDGYLLAIGPAADGASVLLLVRADEEDVVQVAWTRLNHLTPIFEFLLRDHLELTVVDDVEELAEFRRLMRSAPSFFPHIKLACVWDGDFRPDHDARDPALAMYDLTLFVG